MKYEYDTLVFIGRMQPPHNGHFNIIHEALKKAHCLIILLGSSNSNRTLRNPFTFEERVEMLMAEDKVYEANFEGRIEFRPIDDHTYSDQEWVKQVQQTVADVTAPKRPEIGQEKIGLIGHAKDNSSYYLKLFPQWGSVDVPKMYDTNSTAIRDSMFTYGHFPSSDMPKSVHQAMMKTDLNCTDAFHFLRKEYEWVKKYQDMWAGTPYPVIFNTVDAIVVCSGHVLLVKRGAMPGKGLWAMPGGYINPDENLEQSMLRELKEETKIKTQTFMLEAHIVKSETFADPHRSARGRVITHAFLIKLPDLERLPVVKGSDDAEKAKWVPISDLRADNMFEDHYHIIRKMIAGL